MSAAKPYDLFSLPIAFEKQTATTIHSAQHNFPEFGTLQIMKVLEEENVFVPTSSTRQQKSFHIQMWKTSEVATQRTIEEGGK